MQVRPVTVLAGAYLALFCGQALPHHSVGTNYYNYEDNPLVLEGAVIKTVEIRNPHSLITVDAPGADGRRTEWLIEWSDGNALRRRAVAVDRLHPGDVVTIHARKHRRVENVGFVNWIELADGTLVRDCGAGIYRGNEFYATCDEAEEGKSGSLE